MEALAAAKLEVSVMTLYLKYGKGSTGIFLCSGGACGLGRIGLLFSWREAVEGSAESMSPFSTSRVLVMISCSFKVVSEMGGVIPDTAEELVRGLPGVGRYTAGRCARTCNQD